MKTKKVLSAVLSTACVLSSLTVSASAAANNNALGSNSLDIPGGYKPVTVQATIPTKAEAFINPYKAVINVTASTDINGTATFGAGIVSPTYKIVNNDTDKALNVSATAKLGKTSGIEMLEEWQADIEASEDKIGFAYLNTTNDSAAKFFDTSYNKDSMHQLVFTADGTSATNIMSLAKSDTTNTNVGFFRVEGECAQKPETAYKDTDSVAFNVVLDLSPSAGETRDTTVKSILNGANEIYVAGQTRYQVAAANIVGLKFVMNTNSDKATANTTEAKVDIYLNGSKGSGATQGQTAIAAGVESFSIAAANVKTGYTPTAGDVLEVVISIGDFSTCYIIDVIA